MDTKWTKGPWWVKPSGGGTFDIETTGRNADAKGKGAPHVARVVFAGDAILIAAAPDLYAALDTFMRLGTMNDQRAIDAARAALAKARGEAP